MIKRYCDHCGDEIVAPKRPARIEVRPPWVVPGYDGRMFDICLKCYQKLRVGFFKDLPEAPQNE